jgi:hypothetical protein
VLFLFTRSVVQPVRSILLNGITLAAACQQVLGRAAWYAPAPLRRLQTRVGLTEASS